VTSTELHAHRKALPSFNRKCGLGTL
jgi:hypothetical protein